MKELIGATLKNVFLLKNVWAVLTNCVLALAVAQARITRQAYAK